MVDIQEDLITDILNLDNVMQQLLRQRWPEAWLQINLPLGSTRALLVIEAGNARTPGRVAEVLGVSRTTVTGLLDRLEAEGLLTRAIDPADRRCFVLQLTAKGQELVRQLEGQRREHVGQALARMAAPDIAALHTGLAALVAALQDGAPPQAAL
jgi:DNA-binding MarR family transcriptional regulator